ncbi:guanylate kinase [Actinomadura madurae]|uniref:guanylate kinase n=1 Tax=Actinomadura madurae TaxID=1993 RepID=UPI0020D22E98|nr:guanylate kinase [Actinomadura madurae]MCP9952921.1 guanylate kinase [Actinomadura madurae]MCQ0006333.1 guanylate kinase [Actinomadura madurae]
MTSRGVILYGPPTSGKDTVTAELARQDDRYTALPKLKVGTGRSEGYRYLTSTDLEKLRATGRLVVETHRYGNVYAVDRDDIAAQVEADKVPIVHMGNVADLQRLRTAIPLDWTSVLLWVPRAVCADRSKHRGDDDTPQRLQAWDETRSDLQATDTRVFNLVIHTDQADPTETAHRIIAAVEAGPRQLATIPRDLD